MECGAISPEVYKELQATILTDIKKFEVVLCMHVKDCSQLETPITELATMHVSLRSCQFMTLSSEYI